MATEFDLIVIGGGSGGLACAQRAAEYGARVAADRVAAGWAAPASTSAACPRRSCGTPRRSADAAADAHDYGFDLERRRPRLGAAQAQARCLHRSASTASTSATSRSAASSCCAARALLGDAHTVDVGERDTQRRAHRARHRRPAAGAADARRRARHHLRWLLRAARAAASASPSSAAATSPSNWPASSRRWARRHAGAARRDACCASFDAMLGERC